MYGGPVGFEGAERYQYPFDSEGGRAISALRRLVLDGTAPETLRIPGAPPPLIESRYPSSGPSLAQLFQEETGIRLESVEVGFSDLEQFNVTAAESRDGSFDVLGFDNGDTPDLIEAGLFLELDELVANHQPSWLDPEFGYVGGEVIVQRLTTYRGTTYKIPTRTHAHLWYYRGDLLEDPAEQAAFEDRYGRELRFPLTWDEQAEVAEFFHRPTADPPLYGSIEWKAAGWQLPTWMSRFASSANPSHFYFNDDGSANVNTEAGIRATEEHRRALTWSEPDATSRPGFASGLFGTGAAFMGNGLSWQAHLGRLDPELPFFDRIRAAVDPGRIVEGKLVRRPAEVFTNVRGVNAFSDPGRHEAAYLYIQWLTGARISSWVSLFPTRVDPTRALSFEDPLIREAYGDSTIDARAEALPRSAPSFVIPGRREYFGALDDELVKTLAGDQTAEQGMKNTEDRWNRLTDRLARRRTSSRRSSERSRRLAPGGRRASRRLVTVGAYTGRTATQTPSSPAAS